MEALSLIDGGPLQRLTLGLQQRLLLLFPAEKYTHRIVPPRMTPQRWDELTKRTPFVGLGWMDWKLRAGRAVRGDVSFALFLVTRNRPDWLLAGDKTAPGVFGMVCMALGGLHGVEIGAPGEAPLGSIQATEAAGMFSEEWVQDGLGAAGITLTIPAVGLVDESLRDSLPDFLQLGAAWDFDGATDNDVISVRKGDE